VSAAGIRVSDKSTIGVCEGNKFHVIVDSSQKAKATGISIEGGSRIDFCEGNKLDATVVSASRRATATGISVDHGSTFTAHKNEITATVKSGGPQCNRNRTTNSGSTIPASGIKSVGRIGEHVVRTGHAITSEQSQLLHHQLALKTLRFRRPPPLHLFGGSMCPSILSQM